MTQIARLFAAATLLLIAAAAPAQDQPYATGDMVLGSPDAPVEIIEYASLTCPHCATFHSDTLKDLKEKYIDTGKAKLVFREFPFDALALRASMLARCAGPSRYFAMLDVLFKQQSIWARAEDPMAELARLGRLGGVSDAKFKACMENQALADEILANRMQGQEKHDIESTPSFIINGDKIAGAQPLATFEATIEKHLD